MRMIEHDRPHLALLQEHVEVVEIDLAVRQDRPAPHLSATSFCQAVDRRIDRELDNHGIAGVEQNSKEQQQCFHCPAGHLDLVRCERLVLLCNRRSQPKRSVGRRIVQAEF